MSRHSLLYALALACSMIVVSALLLVGTASAGGFQLGVQTPEGMTDGALKDAVLVVRTYGCHTPADAVVSGVAEGVVNGQRRSVKLTLTPTSTGVYAIRQQWPSEGAWVLSLYGDYNGWICSVLVQLGESGEVMPGTHLEAGSRTGTNAQSVQRKWTTAEIDAALKTTRPVASDDRGSKRNTWGVAGAGAALSLAGLFVLGRRISSTKRAERTSQAEE